MAQRPHQPIFKGLHSMHCPARFTLPLHCSCRYSTSPAHHCSDISPLVCQFPSYEAHTEKHQLRSPPSRKVRWRVAIDQNWTKRVIRRERDRTLRAGTLLDTDLLRGSRQPPVRSKTEPPSGVLAENSKGVTPWLFRRVNTPVSPTSRHPERAVADVMGSPKPPSYHAVQETYPSMEMSTGAARDCPADTILPRSPRGLPWPNWPNRAATPSGAAYNNLGQSGLLRSATEADRSRPVLTIRRGTPPELAHPPCYRFRELSSVTTLPPYSATGGNFEPSKEFQPQDLRRKPSSECSGEEPLLPESAVSHIRAAYKVSKELGNAVMVQEVRVATPMALTPCVRRRFVSVTELESIRKIDARADRRSGEREARQRVLSKPADCAGRKYDGKIRRTASERMNPMKIRDKSRR